VPAPSANAPAPSALNREAATLPSSSAAPVGSVTEIVERPDGMRRGKWEAPPWFFLVFASVTVLAIIGYGVWRMRQSTNQRVRGGALYAGIALAIPVIVFWIVVAWIGAH
jgi:hypothetical protein